MAGSEFDIGICRETKNHWERRAPLTPSQVAELSRVAGLRFAVQPSSIRVFSDDDYFAAGAVMTDDLSGCRIVLGVKEMPMDSFRLMGSYAFFAHVVKGQRYNMPMLRRLAELGCNLVEYERITDDTGRRLVFFGRYAGIAGMVETLVALGLRLTAQGIRNPFADMRPPHQYEHVGALMSALGAIGYHVRRDGLPEQIAPLVVGVAGYGHVSQGALEVLDALGATAVDPDDVPAVFSARSRTVIYRTVFKEQHLVDPIDRSKAFDLEEYYRHPERFRPAFEDRLPYLTVLVNCILWTDRYPRLVTREWLKSESAKPDGARLRVIGDISCDVRGAIEATVRVTDPGSPVFVYDPETDAATDGVDGRGVAVMAIDNLPCELPADASIDFGRALGPFVPYMARVDLGGEEAFSVLPRPLARALVLQRGKLTSDYRYITRYLE
jgi:alpha-aminoadipic semialdehyde synthase